jgi:hypothetical protein
MLIRLLLGAKQARATILSWWKVGSKEFHKTLWHFVVSLPTVHRTKMLRHSSNDTSHLLRAIMICRLESSII